MDTYNLRLIEESDLDFISEIRQDPKVQKYLGTFLVTNKKKQKEWYDSLINDKTKMYMIFECNKNEKIGYIRLSEIDYINKSVCVGGDIHQEYRGGGLSKHMYDCIFDLCFNQFNMNRIWLLVMENNAIARHIYKKYGFKEEGCQREAIYRDGKYYDYIMMSILKQEFNKL